MSPSVTDDRVLRLADLPEISVAKKIRDMPMTVIKRWDCDTWKGMFSVVELLNKLGCSTQRQLRELKSAC